MNIFSHESMCDFILYYIDNFLEFLEFSFSKTYNNYYMLFFVNLTINSLVFYL